MSSKIEQLAQEGKINPDAGIRDKQVIVINASVETCFDTLTAIKEWPEWNQEIKIRSCETVEHGAKFNWRIGSFSINSEIHQFERPFQITWTGKAFWIRAIHTWKFEKAEKNQTIVTSEESMQGFLLPLFYTHQKLHTDLLNWLSRLKHKIESVE